jgi:hypothetical protein
VNREGEHAFEAMDAVRPPGVPRLEDHLRVPAREEAVAEALELVPQRFVIVDAAVEDEVKPQLRIDHRLRRAVRKIDDPEALVPEPDPPAHQLPARIRPPPLLAAHHLRHGIRIGDTFGEAHFPRYAAHAAAALLIGLSVIPLVGSRVGM